MLNINTNLSGLIVQSSLKSSTNGLNTAIERMTTGFKINHAKDNAANFSINTKLSSKISSYMVAEENCSMGLDMINTTSEALSQMSNNLSKIRALAVQAQNGTYGKKSLNAITSEANELLAEINRINETASYNGIKLFSTGRAEVTNAGKELELNEQGFLQDIVKRDTSAMTKLADVDSTTALSAGTYSISTAEELAQLAEMTNAGFVSNNCEFVLSNDIDLSAYKSGEGWTPIGLKSKNAFVGKFDGNGYAITNLYINTTSIREGVGLFGYSIYSGSSAEIKNLKIIDCDITGMHGVGGILGGTSGSNNLQNCSVTGKITAKTGAAGGITAGGFQARTRYCYVNISVTAATNAGGISSGNNYGSTINSFAEGSVTGSKEVGGVVGAQYSGTFKNNKSLVTVKGKTQVGGLLGGATIAANSSYFGGSVTGDSKVAGVCGDIWNASGTIISDCIVEGTIRGNTSVAIFLGSANQNSQNSKIADCYYYGKNVGGLSVVAEGLTMTFENIKDITIPSDYTLQVGINSNEASSTLTCTTYIEFSGLQSVLNAGIEDAATLSKIDEIAKIVSLKQTELGTVSNRLESVLEQINIQYDNLISAQSTIRDADIAEESSAYIRNQILQQASATLLATANQTPAIALQLL